MPRGGQPGNKNGSKGKPWQDAINRALARRKDSGGTVDGGLNALADKFLEAVADGGVAEFKEMADRLDGKAHQSTDSEVTIAALPTNVNLTNLTK
jgi:molecular chaperone GrpE (heat shock protein)